MALACNHVVISSEAKMFSGSSLHNSSTGIHNQSFLEIHKVHKALFTTQSKIILRNPEAILRSQLRMQS